MKLLWQDWTFRMEDGDLYTVTFKFELSRWEVLSLNKYVTPVVFPDHDENANEQRAREIVARLPK